MDVEDWDAMVSLVEEAQQLLQDAMGMVGSGRPRTAMAWLKRSRKHLRTAMEILKDHMEGGPN